MNKLTAIKIKLPNGEFSDEIPIQVLASNVTYDSSYSLADALGEIDIEEEGDVKSQMEVINKKASEANLRIRTLRDKVLGMTGTIVQNKSKVNNAVLKLNGIKTVYPFTTKDENGNKKVDKNKSYSSLTIKKGGVNLFGVAMNSKIFEDTDKSITPLKGCIRGIYGRGIPFANRLYLYDILSWEKFIIEETEQSHTYTQGEYEVSVKYYVDNKAITEQQLENEMYCTSFKSVVTMQYWGPHYEIDTQLKEEVQNGIERTLRSVRTFVTTITPDGAFIDIYTEDPSYLDSRTPPYVVYPGGFSSASNQQYIQVLGPNGIVSPEGNLLDGAIDYGSGNNTSGVNRNIVYSNRRSEEVIMHIGPSDIPGRYVKLIRDIDYEPGKIYHLQIRV